MSKAPAFQFYPGDVQRDTGLSSCSLAAFGLWHRMLWAMFDGQPFGHLSVNGSVIPPVNLARLLRVTDEELATYLPELEAAGVFSRNEAGVIYCRRMVRDAKRRETNAANGSKGGNPRLSKSVNRKVKGKDIPLTADADSSTVLKEVGEGTRETVRVEPRTAEERALRGAANDLPFSSPDFTEAVYRWEKHRKEKRQVLTPSTREAWLKKCQTIGEARAIAAIDHSIEKGWTGMYEPGGNQLSATDLRKSTISPRDTEIELGPNQQKPALGKAS